MRAPTSIPAPRVEVDSSITPSAAIFADASPHPDISELYTDILAEKYPLQK